MRPGDAQKKTLQGATAASNKHVRYSLMTNRDPNGANHPPLFSPCSEADEAQSQRYHGPSSLQRNAAGADFLKRMPVANKTQQVMPGGLASRSKEAVRTTASLTNRTANTVQESHHRSQ